MDKIKVLITGASGFIGTNLMNYYLETKYSVLNIDIVKPKVKSHTEYWRKCDINDLKLFEAIVLDYQPDYIVHLAARTDLDGKSINAYKTNIGGVRNLVEILKKNKNLKKVIFTSSMLVYHGGMPKNNHDYNPVNYYGESKMIGEQIVREDKGINFNYVFIRPTSIWGAHFGIPYRNFFDIVLKGKYFHIGNKSCTKTYGYIDNSIYQIDNILMDKNIKNHKEVFYIGDYEPTNIEEWANEIANDIGMSIHKVPFFLIKSASFLGDILKVIGISFPITSFRLKNMTTNNVIDLSKTKEIAPKLPFLRLEGVAKTLKWIQNTKIK